MLNNDALAELGKLKKIIEDNKDAGEGIVVGSQGRYGFVKLDDGRSIYLAAEVMQRVLPGDRIQVEVVTNDKNKSEAKLEKLLQKNFKHFIGTYTVKGNNHFVVPDHREINRGLFVPPKERKKYQQGDFVQCQVTRHPFADGRSQVKITKFVGRPDDAGIDHTLVAFKYRLAEEFALELEKQANTIAEQAQQLSDDREDLTHLPFVTIDAESTLDLDDAIFTEATDEGWTLYSAIADPAAFIEAGSALDKAAFKRASSVYFPGKVLPMLPPGLANDSFSLNPEQRRPALVCKMQISKDGEIKDYQFINALVQSRGKLSYEAVSKQLDQNESVSDDAAVVDSLANLQQLAQARRNYRQQHCLLQDDNPSHRFQLNDKLQIESISLVESTSAHRLVEEAMLATNLCAGKTLADNKVEGALFACHGGFRSQRVPEAQNLLKQEKPDYPRDDIDSFAGFTQLFRALDANPDDQQLKITLRRLLQGSEISNQALPHFGLGFKHYALITSPIRRYQDLHNHRLIKQLIQNGQAKSGPCAPEKLQEQIAAIRAAQRELDQRLLCQFLAAQVGQIFDAKIMAVSSQGLALRLVDNGAESFVQLRNSDKLKVKYDSVYLTLTVNDTVYQLEQVIKVTLDKVLRDRYQLQLSLV